MKEIGNNSANALLKMLPECLMHPGHPKEKKAASQWNQCLVLCFLRQVQRLIKIGF